MAFAPPRLLLARLRSSTRLAALVLLIFALKIGAVAACAKHEVAELGVGTGGSGWVLDAVADAPEGNDDPASGALSHAGACSHCHCHHSAAMLPQSHIPVWALPQGLASQLAGLPPSTSPSLELRPPIA